MDKLAKGCCSAASPCNHQKQRPHSICEACLDAWALEAAQRIVVIDANTYTQRLAKIQGEVRTALARAYG